MPKGPVAELEQISAHQEERDFDAALVSVDRALMRFPGNRLISVKRGVVLRKLNRVAESVSHLSALAKQHPSDPRVHSELAVSLRFAGEFARSLSVANGILANHPDHRPTHLARIDTQLHARDFEAALVSVDHALTHFPTNRVISLKRGLVLRKLHRLSESVSHFSALAEQYPSDPRVNHEFAVSLRFAGEYERSLAVTDSILAKHPDHQLSHYARVDTYAHAQNMAGILDQLRVARENYETQKTRFLTNVLSHHIFVALRHSRTVFSNEAWVWGFLENNLASLTSDQLMTVYEAGLFSPDVADGLLSRVAQALFEQENVSSKACEKIINILHSEQLLDFENLARRVIDKTPIAERNYLRLYVISLAKSANDALKLRKLYLPKVRKTRDLLFLYNLLRQSGKVALVARYMRFLNRQFPDSTQIKGAMLASLNEAGEINELKNELSVFKRDLNSISTKHMHFAINGFINTGDLEVADMIFEKSKAINHSSGLLNQMIRVKHSLGLTSEADRLIQTIKDRAQTPATLHYQASLIGSMQGEMEVERLHQAQSGCRKLTCSITSLIRKTASESVPSQETRPEHLPARLIHQYWHKPKPPDDIQSIIDKWKDTPDFEHNLYDQSSARRILEDELGADWLHAFDLARSPAEQSDFFRLCILMLRGGIYVDCDDAPTGNIRELHGLLGGFTVFAEPFGHVANNFLASTMGHSLVKCAAISAKLALSRKHNENTWFKTGPGLLSRATYDFLCKSEAERAENPVNVFQRHVISRYVQFHIPLPYKRTKSYWNNSSAGHAYAELEAALRKLAQ